VKIAVSATAPNLSAQVDPRFGRCQCFIIADTETDEFEALDNPSAMAGGGAGIATAQLIVDKGVEVVLTGSCGPNAFSVLGAAGIKVITDVSGLVQEAVEEYKAGKYKTDSQANVSPHSGMGRT
jgi:predicted Fe-Mo cluster-binding NifX family protein